MKMKICAEALFLYNFIIDYAVLYSAAVIWHARGRPLISSLLLNAVYLVLTYFFGLYPPIPYLLLICGVKFGFAHKSAAALWGMLLTVCICEFLIGSITLGLMAVFDTGAGIVVLPCSLLMFTVKRADKSVKLAEVSGIYKIRLETGGHYVVLDALADTGNSLYIEKKPAIIADEAALLRLTEQNPQLYKAKCTTVAGESELDYFYADMVFCGKKTKNVCAAISKAPISGTFNAVINPELLLKKEE